mmetsp:Transcript_22660/g.42595  ORF Transcript_22660/g.42595 Transcript_22660/m.42595 type:complete len:699 (+) Transcript_22660:104-2200(+)
MGVPKGKEENGTPQSPKMAHFEIEDGDHSHEYTETDEDVENRRSFFSERTSHFTKSTRQWAEHVLDVKNFEKAQSSGFFDVLGHMFMVVVLYYALLFMIGEDNMLPGGGMFCMTLIWFCSLVGGFLMDKAHMPPLLGMLISGMVLKNWQYLPGMSDPVAELPASWSEGIRAAGLSVILMRSGLELDIPAVKKAGMAAVRLTACPGIIEAFVVAIGGMVIFDMEFPLALSMGFILAAVSPAVVVVGMFNLQKAGYGINKGIPSLVVAAASFDDVVAISGFSIAVSFAIPSHGEDHSMAMTLMHGPLEIIFGVLLGFTGGAVLSATRIWNKRWKRSACVLGLGMLFMFGMLRQGFSGAGAMGGLIMGMVGSVCWREGKPALLAKRADEHYIHHAESDLALLWSLLCQPLLFGVIGTALDFGLIPAETIPKSILVCCFGLLFRLPIAFFATYGKGLTQKERGFVALSWIPKATVQAALCAVPLDKIKESMENNDEYTTEEYQKWEKWGYDILTTAVLSILLTAPLGLIFIQVLGPRWLSKDIEDEVEPDEEDPLHGALDDEENMSEEQKLAALAASDSSDLKTLMLQKIRKIEATMNTKNGHLTHTELMDFRKAIWQVKKVAEVCSIEGGGTKLLDTAGNFFRVANTMEKKEERRASRSNSMEERERRASAPSKTQTTKDSGMKIVNGGAIVKKEHANTML